MSPCYEEQQVYFLVYCPQMVLVGFLLVKKRAHYRFEAFFFFSWTLSFDGGRVRRGVRTREAIKRKHTVTGVGTESEILERGGG